MSKDVATRSETKSISEAEKTYGRAAARIQVATAVWALWDRLRMERDVDQQWLADRMGKNKSWASRLLKGPGNWTLDTVGDLLEAMGGRLTLVEAHTYDEIARGKAGQASRHGGSRTIVKITAEIEVVCDDADRAEMREVNWSPTISYDALRPRTLQIAEREETL